MSKIIAIFASLLLIPSLAFAQGACPTLSDQQYVDFLTAQPFVTPLDDPDDVLGIDFRGTATTTFKTDGTVTEHLSFRSNMGKGTLDATADWSVLNANLSIHMTSMTHSDTGNNELNENLDYMIDEVMAMSDFTVPLNDCDNYKRSLRGFSIIMKK